MYRYEAPQRGRLREFWQLNVDIFGCDGYEADLDCISSAIEIMRAFGADETMFTVHINNRRFFNDVIAALEAKGYTFASADISLIPQTYVKLTSEEDIKNMEKLLDMLEDNEDVQNTYHNWETED